MSDVEVGYRKKRRNVYIRGIADGIKRGCHAHYADGGRLVPASSPDADNLLGVCVGVVDGVAYAVVAGDVGTREFDAMLSEAVARSRRGLVKHVAPSPGVPWPEGHPNA